MAHPRNVYRDYDIPEGGGGLYIKFEDGKQYILRIASEPVVYETIFDEGTDKEKTSTKFAWIVWDIETKSARILQLPISAFRMVRDLALDEEYGDPLEEGYNLKISRTGTALDTKYSVKPGVKRSTLAELDPKAPDEVEKIDLIERIKGGNNVHHVNWMKDAIGQDAPKPLRQSDVARSTHEDVVLEDIDDKPIDLSEIPF